MTTQASKQTSNKWGELEGGKTAPPICSRNSHYFERRVMVITSSSSLHTSAYLQNLQPISQKNFSFPHKAEKRPKITQSSPNYISRHQPAAPNSVPIAK